MNGNGLRPPSPDLRAGELEEATRAVAAEVAAGRPGVVLSRGPAGYALICGAKSERIKAIDGGALIAFGFDRRQLAVLGARIQQLLRGDRG